MLSVIKFSAQWCGPCKRLAPIYDSIKAAAKDVDFKEIDIDDSPAMAAQYNIMSIPTLVFEKDGVEISRLVGLVKEADIKKAIDEMR
jgi:thioredoxin 1